MERAVSVVVPVYHEDKNILKTLDAIAKHVPEPREVLIAYDSDDDSTLPAARSVAHRFPEMRLVKNTVARGPSGALRTAFAQAKHPLVLVMMADLCDDFTQLKSLLAMVPEEADLVAPSRYCEGGRQEVRASWLKVKAPRAAGFLLRRVAGLPTSDPTNSFKLYSKAMLDRLSLVSTSSFSVTLEIVAKAHCLGYRIKEVPTVWIDREDGASNFKLGRSLVTYLPWFFLALAGGPWVPIPRAWLERICSRRESA